MTAYYLIAGSVWLYGAYRGVVRQPDGVAAAGNLCVLVFVGAALIL